PLGQYVFPGSGESGHLSNLKRPWRQICRAAGITGLRIHDLRHSYASQLVSGGASLPLIGALLGHSNPTTTHRYAHLFDDPQRAATEKVGAIIMAAGKPAKDPVPFPPKPRRYPMARRRKLQYSVPGPIGAPGKVTLHDDRIVLIRPPYTRHGARQGSEDKGLRFEYVQQAVMGVLGALPPKDTKLNMSQL